MMAVVQYLLVVLGYTLVSQVAGQYPCCDNNSVTVDLNHGNYTSTTDLASFGMEIYENFTDGPAAENDWRVVFKVTFDPPGYCRDKCTATCHRRMLNIFMRIDDDREGYLANFGNSPTNDGDKGDDPDTHFFDANILIVNETIKAHANDNCTVGFWPQNVGATDSTVTIRIASGYYRIEDEKPKCDTLCFFNLFGNHDPQLDGPNDLDFFVSFNKVIKAGSLRTGRGVKEAKLSWDCCAG